MTQSSTSPYPLLTIQTLTQDDSDADWDQATVTCNARYDRIYGTHWIARPDILFVAHDEQGPAATAGLELGRLRQCIDTERYFHLTPRMREFINDHRNMIAEFGRFTGEPRVAVLGARAVLREVIRTCNDLGIEYLFAWSRPEVARHGASVLGVPFWTLEAPLNEATITTCPYWVTPPVEFFFGKSTQRPLFAAVRFFDYVLQRLDANLAGHIIHQDVIREAS